MGKNIVDRVMNLQEKLKMRDLPKRKSRNRKF